MGSVIETLFNMFIGGVLLVFFAAVVLSLASRSFNRRYPRRRRR